MAMTSNAAFGWGHHTSIGVSFRTDGDTAGNLPPALYHMDEGPLSAATYMENGKFAYRAPELDETFERITATRRESVILRAVAEALRADSHNLKLMAARLSTRSAQIRTRNRKQEEPV